MGHDEETNNFNGGATPSPAPNPRAQIGNNRLGMRPSRNLSAMDELNRISADSNPNAAAPAETGDIVLNAGEKKPKDKKVIIIAILAVAIVAVFAVGLIMRNSKSGGNTGGAQTSGDYKTEFNQFANYIISGEIKDDALTGANDGLRNYAFNKAMRGDDDTKKRFIEEAYNLFEKFNIDFTASEINNDDLKSRVASYYSNLKMLYLYETSEKLDDSTIAETYVKNSEEAARNLVDSSYSKLVESDSEVAKAYGEQLREVGRTYITQLAIYSGLGCMNQETGLDINCAHQKAQNDENTQNYFNARFTLNRTYSSTISEVTGECWGLSEMINSNNEGTENENENA